MKRVNIKYLVISAALILVLTLSSGCALLNPDAETSPPPNSSPTNNTIDQIDSDWVPSPVDSDASALPSTADVVAKVKPSVVAINVEIITYDIFNRPSTQQAAGSGWIISENGYVVTNNHVVEGAESITVILDDDRAVTAKVVGTDWLADLAVLKIDAENLIAATVGDSLKLRVGDWVVAIGNALGEGISATTGIVSALGIQLSPAPGQTLYNLVQTDAAINPGNSGGPLVNMAGEVIGINSIKTVQVEVEGVGYAISTNEAMPIIQQLINTGYVIRPFLGVQGLLTVDQSVADYFDLKVNAGALIRGIVPDGPADQAGLEAGDVITKFEGQEIANVDELIRALYSSKVGQGVEITFRRGETEMTATLILAESPPPS
ncbi:hypothetical protein ES703_43386 [subsurface metagenome]